MTVFRKSAGATSLLSSQAETGTGRSSLRAIPACHQGGTTFSHVSCGAIPETLVQRNSLDITKGITGAVEERIGHFEAAAGGTVFLDEIENLSAGAEVSLLRFLQEKIDASGLKNNPCRRRKNHRFRRSNHRGDGGGRHSRRLVLPAQCLAYRRTAVKRRDTDAAEIAEYFVDRFHQGKRRNAKRLSKAVSAILEYSWPGNVRELMSCVNRAAVLSTGRLITEGDLGLSRPVRFSGRTLREIKAQAVEQAVMSALAESKSITSAARRLGVSRVTLYRLMEKHAITVPGAEHAAG